MFTEHDSTVSVY